MPRSLSDKAIEEMQSIESVDPFLELIEINHSTWPTPFRIVDNTPEVISGGKTYIPWPFDLILSDDDGERLPEMKFTIDNVDPVLIEIIRGTLEAPRLSVRIVLASDPDTVEVFKADLILRDVEFDAQTITWNLFSESLADQRYPADSISLATGYHGLFRI